MTLIEILIQFVLPIILAVSGYIFGMKRTSIENRKLKIEAELEDIDLTERRISSYKKQLTEMQEEIEGLRSQISELKDLIENLTMNQCLGDDCPTKKAYDKIIAQRIARKNNRNKKNQE